MHNSKIRSALVFFLVTLIFSGCEKEHFYSEYAGICGSWSIKEISGGFSGGGYEPNFDILLIDNRMHYSLFFNNTLLSEGKIEITEQTSENLRVEFKSRNKTGDPLSGWEKEVFLNLDTLLLNDGCCDMYSYFFVRTDI